MGLFKRIWTVFSSVLLIALSVLLALYPEVGAVVFMTIIGLMLLFYGLSQLFYFIGMARWKVGGQKTLYLGIICIDFGLATLSINQIHPQLVMLYLLIYFFFIAVIRIYSAIERKKQGAKSWRMRLTSGIVCLVIAILCILNFSSVDVMVYILCFGFIYYAIMQIVMAFRRSTVIYIQ